MKKMFKKLGILILTILIGLSLSSCEFIESFFDIPTPGTIVRPSVGSSTVPAIIDKDWTTEELKEFINDISLEVMKANVKVITETTTGGLFNQEKHITQGSGVIFHQSQNRYYILTNEHVAKSDGSGKTEYMIYDYKGNEYKAYLIENSLREDYDLAILYFVKQEDLKVLALSSKNPLANEFIISLGQPQGQLNTITLGTVEKYVTAKLSEGTSPNFKVIRHNAPIDNGSSGGAILNAYFQIVGINFAGADHHEYSLAVPIEKVIEYLDLYFN